MTVRPPLVPSLRGLPRAFWHLWLGGLINRVGSFVVPFLALYLTAERKLPVEEAGFIVALYGIGSFAAGPLGGFLADHYGRKITMAFALLSGSAAMLHLGFARAPAQIGVGALLLGLFSDMYRPASAAMIADMVPPADRVRAYALSHWAANLGFSIAPVVAGLMAKRGFSTLFVADAVTTAAFAVLVAVKIPETHMRAPAGAHQGGGAPHARFLTPYRDHVFLAFVLLTFVVAMMFHQMGVALPLDMRAHGVSEREYGALLSLNGLLIVFVQPFAVPFVQRFRQSHVLAIGTLFIGAGFGMTGLVSTIPLYAASIAIWTVGEIVMTPIMPSVIADLSPAHLRGSYQGAHQMAWGASSFAAPVVGSLVLARFGAPSLWAACFVAAIVAAAAQVTLAAPRRRRVAELRAAAAIDGSAIER